MLDVVDAQSGVRASERLLDFAPVDRGDPHPELRLRCFAVEPIPEQAGGMKDFNRADRRRCITVVQYDDRDIQKAGRRSWWVTLLRSAFRHRRLLTRVAHFPFYPWPFAFTFELDRFPQTDQSADRIQDERDLRDAGNNEGMNNNCAAERGSSPDGIIHILTRRYGVQCDDTPLSSNAGLN